MAPLFLLLSYYTSLLKCIGCLIFARLYKPQQPPQRDLSGQTAIVTGANSGIGLSIAVALAKQGAAVCLACRNVEKGHAAVQEVVTKAGGSSGERVFCWKLDVGDLESVKIFCERWKNEGKQIDMLVHNAGIPRPPPGAATKTSEGLGMTYVTNFLGSFLMTSLLEDSLSNTARVVCTSSTGHYSARASFLQSRSTTPSANGILARLGSSTPRPPGYSNSKAQQVLFTYLLQRHFSSLPDNKRTAHVFSPGFTSTPIFGKFGADWKTWFTHPDFALLKATEKWVAVDTDEGAKTGAWLASCGGDEQIEAGRFWDWMTIRTSLIDLLRGKLGEAGFRKAAREEWSKWEKDAGVSWDIEI